MTKVPPLPPPGAGHIIGGEKPLSKGQNAEREMILELGRKFEKTIEDFSIDKQSDISFLVIMGATDYLIKSHKNRMNEVGQYYLKLKGITNDLGMKVHEPYANDGVEAPPEPLGV